MCMVLKTFKLSKNPLVHLLYLILIVTTVSNQADDGLAGPTPILSNEEKGSTINGKMMEEKKNTIKGYLDMLHAKNIIKQPNENEINNIDPKENNIRVANNMIEDQKVDDEEDPFASMTLDLVPEDSITPGNLKPEEKELEIEKDQNIEDRTTSSKKKKKKKKNNKNESEINPGNLKPEEKELEAENYQNNKDTDPTQSNLEKDGMMEEKKNTIKEIFDRMNAINSTKQPNENEINNIDPKENNIRVANNMIEDQKVDDEEDPFARMTLDLVPEDSIIPGNLKPEEKELETENYQNIEDRTTSSKKKKKKNNKIESEINPDTQDTPHPLGPINPKDLTLSSLENVGIIKIKGEVDPVSEAIRKEKKRNIFKEFAPTEGNARIYCTFLGNVLKMYNKVKKRFIGHFCHAIVFGAPIILKNHRVHLSENMRDQLRDIHSHKDLSLLIVIMEFPNYKFWVQALNNNKGMKNLIIDIIHTVVHYKIDGIQFSNLHPKKETDEVNPHMMNNLIKFFEKLEHAAKAKNHDLKIGITIDMHGLSIIKSFTSFKHLNLLVTWYSFKTISMVTCSSDYKDTSTSPLEGNMGFKKTINTLIEKINDNNEFDMTKLVVGIQLFPNKEDDSHPYTYEELCSSPKDTWHTWCAAKPEDNRAKGRFLRGTQIGGVQLYYMHSDDYRSTCGCYSFPLIRALLRGLIKVDTPETCNFETAHN